LLQAPVYRAFSDSAVLQAALETADATLPGEEYRQKLQVENAYEDYKRERVEQYIDEELDPEEYKKLFTAHKKEVASKYKSLQLNPTSASELAHGSVRTEIMARIPVLSFEEFSREQNFV
jgi:hypothetical protein